jgi:hypothetical protein
VLPLVADEERLVVLHLDAMRPGTLGDRDALHPDHHAPFRIGRGRALAAPHALEAPAITLYRHAIATLGAHPAGRHVVGAEELRGVESLRLRVDIDGRALLHDDAVLQQQHVVGHRQRLALIVRHHDGARAQLDDQPADPEARFFSQLGVEVRQGLVQQQHLRLVHQRAANGHALLLAARQLVGVACREVRQAQLVEDGGHAAIDLGARHVAQLEPIAHVLRDRAVRPQGVGLEHEPDLALLGRERHAPRVEHGPARDLDAALLRNFEARDAAQQRGLSAAGCAEEREDAPLLRGEARTLQDRQAAEALLDIGNDELSHACGLRAAGQVPCPRR